MFIKPLFISFLFALVICTPLSHNKEDVQRDGHIFNMFLVEHNKQYNAQELSYRRDIFLGNLKKIEEHNNKNSSFQLGITKFADLTTEEYIKATFQSPIAYHHQISSHEVSSDQIAPPESLDWRTHNDPPVVGPVKDAGQCGSSLVISIVDSISSDYSVQYNMEFWQFQYGYVADCDGETACSTQNANTVWNFITKFGLSWYSDGCPTQSEVGICISGPNCTKSGSEADLLAAVAKYGPISIFIDASQLSFQLYKTGIYYEPQCSSSRVDHSVLLVGYGSMNGQDYWIARNSWGTSWGLSGDILIARNRNNNCGVATSACFAKNIDNCRCFAEPCN